MSQLFLLLHFVLLSCLLLIPTCKTFMVIMSDSGVPSAPVDAPQTGFTMNKNGSRTDIKEQEAIYDIMRATGNDWATDIPDVCRGRWHGIECMPDKDKVYHIVSLSFGALSDDTAFPTCDPTRSFISPSVTKLPHIRTMFFYRCFTQNPQPIPAFLGQLGENLQTLVLRENDHIGPIPDAISNLTHLKVLDLHRNNLNGSIPVSLNRITGLRSLDLSGNRLTGPIPKLALPLLTIIDLNQNHLTGTIPATIGSCISLMKIDVSRNHLSGPIPDSIEGLSNLIIMDLSYNHLSAPLPTTFRSLKSLQALILKGNPIASTIPEDAFNGMNDLMILVLSNMNLIGPIPESLGRLPSLHVLHLDRNHLNGSIPLRFGELKDLSELRLSNNQLIGVVPFRRETVWRMRRKLRLYNNSGLCCNPKGGYESDLDFPFDSGIGYCEMFKSGSSRTVQHLGSIDGSKRNSAPKSATSFRWIPIINALLCIIILV